MYPIECKLQVGDLVMLDYSFGGKYAGESGKVTKIKRWDACRSGFRVWIDFCPYKLDSDWLVKVKPNEQP